MIFTEKVSGNNSSNEIDKLVDLQSVMVNMESEECAIPKSFGAGVARCGITVPLLNVFLSESRLSDVSQTLDQVLLRLAVKKECKIDLPAQDDTVLKESLVSAEGHADAFADYYVNIDTIILNLLTDQCEGDSQAPGGALPAA